MSKIDHEKVRQWVRELCFDPDLDGKLGMIARVYPCREPEFNRAIEIALGHLREMLRAEQAEATLTEPMPMITPRAKAKPKRRRRQPTLFDAKPSPKEDA